MSSHKRRKYSLFHVMVFGITSFIVLLIVLYSVAITAIFAFEEMLYFEHEMRKELALYEKALSQDPKALPASTAGYDMVFSYDALPKRVQDDFADEVIEEGEVYHSFGEDDEVWLMKFALKDGRFLFVSLLDPDYELPEDAGFDVVDKVLLLFAGVLVITVVVVILFAYSILRQVRSLEGYIASMSLENFSHARPALSYKEFDAIAEKFEHSTQRSADFLKRESEFLSFASHELRTPLAIVAGNLDVLKLNRDSIPKPVLRMERACRSMQLAVETLLWLGREASQKPDAPDTVCHKVISSSLETWRTMFAKQAPQVMLQIDDLETSTSNGAFGLVADNLIRNAFQHGDKDGIEVSFKDAVLTIRNRIAPGETEAKGIGILMCERICARSGWQLSLDATDGIFTAKVTIQDA